MPTVILLSSDLMVSRRVTGAAGTLGVPVALVARQEGLTEKLTPACRLLLIDLGMPNLDLQAAVAATRSAAPQARIVAYGEHVDEAALAAAQAARCDMVLTRGQFHMQYAELLRQAAAA
jgi:DNA-binding NarL/FixJ family response regulator